MSEPTKGTFAVEIKEAQDPVPPWLNLNFYSSPDHLPADAMMDLEIDYPEGLDGWAKMRMAEEVARFVRDHVRAVRIWRP